MYKRQVKVDFKDENIADVYVKLEKFNLSGSVKDRAALGMIEAAEKEGLLKEGSVIIAVSYTHLLQFPLI